MGYSLPSGVVNTDSVYFYAGPSLTFGPLVKALSDQTLVIIDYSQLAPTIDVTDFDFAVDASSNPALVVSYAKTDAIGTVLSFLLSGGIVGQQYNLSITVNATRTDVLTVNIPSSSGDCAMINPVPGLYTQLPLGSMGYVNSAVRYFWGTQPPANPGVMDQWYNSSSQTLYEWATDGVDFFWQTLMSADLVTDAPASSLLFSRFNNRWVVDPIQSDATQDGRVYGRWMGSWTPLPAILPDAPSDGLYYSRLSGAWRSIPIQSDAPVNASIYGRSGGAWIALAPIITEAPSNGQLYSRSNGGWLPTPIQIDAPADGRFYARNNRAWLPVLIEQFISDAPNDGTLYGRQDGGWIAAYPESNPNNYTTAAQVAASVALMMPRAGGNFTGAIGAPGYIVPNGPATLQIAGGQPGQILVAANTNSTFMWGPAPIPEPPNDGTAYARENGLWVPTASGAGLPEAPQDGTTYSRNNATWVHLTHLDITDWTATLNTLLAPYALITMVPLGSASFPLMDGTNAIGTSLNWARADHVHPTDTSRYAATNPSGYQTAAQVTAALAPYALASAVPGASNASPLMNGTAAPGGSAAFSRGDHVHPSDTAKLSLSGGTMTGLLTLVSNPVGVLDAVPKQYVDSAAANANIDCGTY